MSFLTVFFFSLSFGANATSAHSDQDRMKTVFEWLKKTPSGALQLKKAQKFWKVRENDISRYVQWGSVSKTDALISRSIHPETGKEIRERQVKVILKKNEALVEQILDLAHELTHAMAKPQWDPYDPTLTAEKYIGLGIEGDGGEVSAVYQECRVAFELEKLWGESFDRCDRYRGLAPQRMSQRIKNDFYKSGKWKNWLQKKISSNFFKKISSQAPELISSTGDLPYPAALYEEFVEMNQAACKNTFNRIQHERTLASNSLFLKSQIFLKKRCKSLNLTKHP
ncbi:MAG: hypothetical protein CL678_06565 [Bdellovibrionaceae bacterium]|nr:hypothetical protein [Pseudobdellovibrionaceae bacterium]|tara:strand:- start:1444 stop:2289 length:846 start_codon:yes stop_codon:yes gene_type:complete